MMKKSLLLISAIAIALPGISQDNATQYQWEKNVYGLKLSPNGKYLGSMAGNASVFTIAEGKDKRYELSFLGLGNPVADSGMAVGNTTGVACVMLNGQELFPDAFSAYWFSEINAVTPDGSRICGQVNGAIGSEVMYVPYVADLDANGNATNLTLLPIPDVDFFRAAPQFVVAGWISEDGKTIGGQVTDWRGMYEYPIVFKEENGEWNYYLPSEKLFNPTGIDIPDNPWLSEPVFPDPEMFMDPIEAAAYLEAFEAWSTAGGEYPYPEDYMTPDEFAEYEAAVDAYNDWYYSKEDAIKAYIKIYDEVLATTPVFVQNEYALSPSGEYIACRGGEVDAVSGDMQSKIFNFNINNIGEYAKYETPDYEYLPEQIMNDGTLLITKGIMDVPTAWIMLPGTDEFITIQEYLISIGQSEVADWLDELCPFGSGVVNMSADKSVITGALYAAQMADFDYEFSDYYYSTYIICLGEAGVKSILDDKTDGVYRVYNLGGVKVLETKDASAVSNLSHGIYIINGKKVIL